MATHAERMVVKYEALLEANPGVQTVSVDGLSVSYADLEAKLAHWKRRVARHQGTRPVATTIRLDRF